MGYKMPNVIKEVYLPYESSDSTITFEKYKEKYGVDIEEYIQDTGTSYGQINVDNAKIYIVIDKTVSPLQEIIDNQNRYLYGLLSLTIGTGQNLIISSFSGFSINVNDKTLNYVEM